MSKHTTSTKDEKDLPVDDRRDNERGTETITWLEAEYGKNKRRNSVDGTGSSDTSTGYDGGGGYVNGFPIF